MPLYTMISSHGGSKVFTVHEDAKEFRNASCAADYFRDYYLPDRKHGNKVLIIEHGTGKSWQYDVYCPPTHPELRFLGI